MSYLIVVLIFDFYRDYVCVLLAFTSILLIQFHTSFKSGDRQRYVISISLVIVVIIVCVMVFVLTFIVCTSFITHIVSLVQVYL